MVQGQGPFYLVGRSWVTWRRRLGVAPAVQFLYLVVVVVAVQGVLRTGGRVGPSCSSSTCVTSLGSACSSGVPQLLVLAVGTAAGWRRREGVAAGAFSPGVGAHHTGGEPM